MECAWFFFFNDTATTEIYTLSLHDALPILADNKINIEMISTSEISISCVIKKRLAQRAVRAIHKKFKLDKK